MSFDKTSRNWWSHDFGVCSDLLVLRAQSFVIDLEKTFQQEDYDINAVDFEVWESTGLTINDVQKS